MNRGQEPWHGCALCSPGHAATSGCPQAVPCRHPSVPTQLLGCPGPATPLRALWLQPEVPGAFCFVPCLSRGPHPAPSPRCLHPFGTPPAAGGPCRLLAAPGAALGTGRLFCSPPGNAIAMTSSAASCPAAAAFLPLGHAARGRTRSQSSASRPVCFFLLLQGPGSSPRCSWPRAGVWLLSWEAARSCGAVTASVAARGVAAFPPLPGEAVGTGAREAF